MSTKHTKGPWEANQYAGGRGDDIDLGYDIENAYGLIANVYADGAAINNMEMFEANARLIAAAPDLLEALVDAEAALRQMDKTIEWEFGDCRSDDEMEADKAWSTQVYTARAAIAKAKGEQG